MWDATLKDIRDTRWDKTTFSGEKLAEIADSQHGFILWPRFNSTHSYRTAFFFFLSHSLVCLSGLRSTFQTREKCLFLYEGNEGLHRASAAKMSKNVIAESEILITFTNFLKTNPKLILLIEIYVPKSIVSTVMMMKL